MSSKKTNFLKIGTIYTLATLFNQGISFVTVVVFTRLLNTNDYGILNTFTSWQSILSIIISMTLYMGIRAAFIDYEQNIDEVMSTVITFTTLIGVLTGAGTLLVARIFMLNVSSVLIVCCFLQAFYSAVLSDYTVYLMMKYEYRLRTLLMVLPELIAAIVSVIAILYLYQEEKYLGKIVPTTVTYVFFVLVMLSLIYKKTKPCLDKKYLKYTLKISLPLVLHGMSLYVLGQSDRLMITSLRNPSETGIYSLVYNFGMVATIITNALNGIWVPWYTESLKKRKIEAINEGAKDYANLMTYAMVALALVAPEILKILAPEEYWEGVVIIPAIVFANYFMFLYTLYVNTEHFHQKTVYTSFNSLVAAICNIVLNLLLIPRYGYIAAAYTTLIAYLLSLMMHAGYAKKLEAEVYPLSFFVPTFVQIIVAAILFHFFLDYWLVRWGIMIAYLLFALVYQRKKIMFYLKGFRKQGEGS